MLPMAGRPKGDRVTTKSAFVRFTEDEYAVIERAISSQLKGIVGAKVTPSAFLREVGLREAKKMLGLKA
jgi:hypothetical protein